MSLLDAPATHRADSASSEDERDGVLRWAGRVLAWTLIIGCAAALAAAVLVPRAAGATPYTILTSSMEPTYPPGTLVVTRPVAVDEIRVGSVITYQLRSGEAQTVTHRVIGVGHDLAGETRIETQGDANSVADEAPVRPEQVRGELWYAVPQLGRLNTLMSGNERQLLVYGAAAVLVMYAGAMFAGATRDRGRGRGRRA